MIDGGCIQLPVADVERSLRFYVERLGVKLVASGDGWARIDLGGSFEVELVRGPSAPGRLILRVRGSFEEAVATYDNRGLGLTRSADHAECTDLDGHVLRFVPHA